jgi:hypothetical protein
VLENGMRMTTNDDGVFRFSGVPEGEHTVALSRTELPAEYDPGSKTEEKLVVKARRSTSSELEVMKLVFVSGKIEGPAGFDLLTVVIRLSPLNRYTTPDENGNFSFYNLPEQDYELILDTSSLPEFAVLSTPVSAAISLRAATPFAPARFAFEIRKPEKPVRRTFEKQ